MGASVLDSGEYNRGINAQGSVARMGPTILATLHREISSNGLPININQFVAFGKGSAVDAYGNNEIKWASLTIQKGEWLELSNDLDFWARLA